MASRPYRVLTIDGGGIRGLYTAILLHQMATHVAKTNSKPHQNLDVGLGFDMICGTSTGAILAIALAAGVPLDRVIQLYRDNAGDIFQSPTPEGKSAGVLWLLKHLLKSANCAQPLQQALTDVFGQETLGELYKRRRIAMCIPSINAETQSGWVFKPPHDHGDVPLSRDDNYSLVDVCLASAAAPIVFPMHGIKKPGDPYGKTDWFVDGGLWGNNPVLVGLSEALRSVPIDRPIELLSLGTCQPVAGSLETAASANRGAKDWKVGIGMLEMSMNAQAGVNDYLAKVFIKYANPERDIKYVRWNDPPVEGDSARHLRMDNPSQTCLDLLAKLGHESARIFASKLRDEDPEAQGIASMLADLGPLETTPQ